MFKNTRMLAVVLSVLSLSFGASAALAKAPVSTNNGNLGLVQIEIIGEDEVSLDTLKVEKSGTMTVAKAIRIAAAAANGAWDATFDPDQTRLVDFGGLLSVSPAHGQNGHGRGFEFIVDGKKLTDQTIFEAKVQKSITIQYVDYFQRKDKRAKGGSNWVIQPARSIKSERNKPRVRFDHKRG